MMHQVNGGDVVFTQVVFSYSGKMLIAGTSNGTIRAVKYPLTDPGEWQEHLAHSSSVTRVGDLYTCTMYMCTFIQVHVLVCIIQNCQYMYIVVYNNITSLEGAYDELLLHEQLLYSQCTCTCTVYVHVHVYDIFDMLQVTCTLCMYSTCTCTVTVHVALPQTKFDFCPLCFR